MEFSASLLEYILPLIDHHLTKQALSRIVPPPMPRSMRKRSIERLRRMQRELACESTPNTSTPEIQVRRGL